MAQKEQRGAEHVECRRQHRQELGAFAHGLGEEADQHECRGSRRLAPQFCCDPVGEERTAQRGEKRIDIVDIPVRSKELHQRIDRQVDRPPPLVMVGKFRIPDSGARVITQKAPLPDGVAAFLDNVEREKPPECEKKKQVAQQPPVGERIDFLRQPASCSGEPFRSGKKHSILERKVETVSLQYSSKRIELQ